LIVSGSVEDIPCGISPYVRRIADGISRLGLYELSVLTSDDPAVNTDVAGSYKVYPRIKHWGPHRAFGICREILKLEPDIVHIQNPTIKYSGWRSVTMSAVGPLLKYKAPNVRLVVMQHDVALSRPVLRCRFRPLFRAADAILVSNGRDYKAIVDQKISTEKIYKAPFSSYIKLHKRSAEIKAQARRNLSIPADAYCVVFFGFVLPERNVHMLIQALKLLRDGGCNVHGLILGGAHGQVPEYFTRCQELARKLLPTKDIRWTGFASADQIADGLAAADVFVSLPSRGADMRNTSIITGILAGIPVVTTENARFYIDDDLRSFGCVFVDPTDPNAIAEGIATCINNPPTDERLGQFAEQLEPARVWGEHIETICRAYEGERENAKNKKF